MPEPTIFDAVIKPGTANVSGAWTVPGVGVLDFTAADKPSAKIAGGHRITDDGGIACRLPESRVHELRQLGFEVEAAPVKAEKAEKKSDKKADEKPEKKFAKGAGKPGSEE